MSQHGDPAYAGPFPPLLNRVVRVARSACPPGHGDALTALAALAQVSVPLAGLLPTNSGEENDIFQRIDAIARRYLGLAEAEGRTDAAIICRVATDDDRQTIEAANARVVGIHDTAYFLFGLSVGITLAELSGGGR